MIKLTTAKLAIASMLAVALLIAGFLAISLSGTIVSTFTSGASTEDALHDVDTVPTMADTLVTWQRDEWTREREMESPTRILLESAYLRAWAAMGAYQSHGDTDAVEDTFSGQARENVLNLPSDEATAMWSLGHQLRLTFYSRDGSIVAFDDERARVVRETVVDGTSTILESVETYSVVMVLEDGYWRIKQLLRTGEDSLMITTASADEDPVVTGVPALPSASTESPGRALTYSYALWADPTTDIASDVAEAVALGAERLRVDLPPPDPTASGASDETLERLQRTIALSRAAGLAVDVVLLSATVSDEPALWPVIDAFVREIVEASGDDIRAIDIMSGVSTADLGVTRAALIAHLSVLVAELAPAVTRTIGWDATASVDSDLQALVDELTLTGDAGSPAFLDGITASTQAFADPSISVVIRSGTTAASWSPKPSTEHAQASGIAATLGELPHALDDAVSVGDLRDLSPDGGTGVVSYDGSPKEAAALVEPQIAPSDVGPVSVRDVLSTRFWQLAGVVIIAVAVWGVFRFRVRLKARRRPEGSTGR
ncbi:hypothetical protein [Microbacterium sp. R86528]|uniref:hypothetical protein n=1 Tax=Microbacterium sp. R86528 TaxID=3093864 RepID=UPI0037C89557